MKPSKHPEQVILETTPVTQNNVHDLLRMLISLQEKKARDGQALTKETTCDA